MPSLEAHCYIDLCFFGRAFPRLHKAIDRPVFLLGRRHRVLFHDHLSAQYIARREYPNDPCAVKSATLHIMYDNICTKDPKFKEYIEYLAQRDKRIRKIIKNMVNALKSEPKKKRTSRATKKTAATKTKRKKKPENEFDEFLRKWERYKKWL